MSWRIFQTTSFSASFGRFSKNRTFIDVLDKKIRRLREDPYSVGGNLAGRLHGKKATRIIGKFRIIFRIDESLRRVYLLAIDHRKFDYKRF